MSTGTASQTYAQIVLENLDTRVNDEIKAIHDAAQALHQGIASPKLRTHHAAQVYSSADVKGALELAEGKIHTGARLVRAALTDEHIAGSLNASEIDAFVYQAINYPERFRNAKHASSSQAASIQK